MSERTDRYVSPLSSRYASEEMLRLFSQDCRYSTWRRLWVSLARAERALGLDISEEQIKELEEHVYDIDYEAVSAREKEVRHDVMAHVYAYGKAAPSAAGIIHLGATSCYVTDNADLVIYRDALRLIRKELVSLMASLADFAERYRALPVPGYTHYQPAQPVTAGKRACLWLDQFVSDLEQVDFALGSIRFLGCRGATGTEASLLELLGSGEKADELNRRIASDFGFDSLFDVCGQTYPRKLDSRLAEALAAIGQSAYKMAGDIRLLQHDGQLEEPFGESQIGSSAMAYKRNPMRCERICSLSRYLMTEPLNAAFTASSQWLERTLDDSAVRRIFMPEAFLCADAVLRLADSVVRGLRVNEKRIGEALADYLPFAATEDILMDAVKAGGDRQQVHETIRRCAMEASAAVREGGECDLLARLADAGVPGFEAGSLKELDPAGYVGRCAEQVTAFLAKVRPLIGEAGGDAPVIEV